VRVLVTGADGFVGRHLCRFLQDGGDTVVPLVGAGGSELAGATSAPSAVDVRDGRALADAVARALPDAIIHLAAVSSVAESHRDPVTTFEVNTLGTLNVCMAARALENGVRLLLVSSGEVYGAGPLEPPHIETAPLAPTSPYGASKVAGETVGIQFAHSYGLHVVVARPFSHLGTGQAPTFAVPSFARQLAEARRDRAKATLRVGNLEAVRDFSHVRDVIAAYRLLLERGQPGEAYNVCSGHGRSLRSVLDELIQLAGVQVTVQVDPARFRPADIPTLVGDPSKLRSLGWTPRYTLRAALADVLGDDGHGSGNKT
jgi:GDP-4-dehydro-6-deoxy-D-mannose reductase